MMEQFRSTSWPANVAEADFKPKKVTQTIHVLPEFRRIIHRREGILLVDEIYNDTGCIVVAHWQQSIIARFDVYGAGPGSKSAVVAINKWIARADQKSKDSSAWAKTPAFNQAQWSEQRLEQMEEEQMEFFLGPIPEMQAGESMRPKITVDWPEDLLNLEVTPATAFGNTLQALDDIRKRDEVFISLLPNSNKVEILGLDIMKIEAAEAHYKTLIERIRTEKCNLQQAMNMILDEREGIDVIMIRAETWWPDHNHIVVPRLLPSPMMDRPGNFRGDGLHELQLVDIRDYIKQALEAVSYKKGSYDFIVRLGCVALDTRMGEDHVGKKHGKEKFLNSINGKVELISKKWLFDNVLGTQLYDHIVTMTDFLEPIKSAGYWGTLPASLEKTYPVLRGTWVFLDPNTSQKQPRPPVRNVGRPAPMQQAPAGAASDITTPSSLIVVQVDWTEDGDGSYDKTGTRFFKLEPGKPGAKANMDLNLLELGESRAWSFALESMVPIPRSTAPPVLMDFAHHVVLQPVYDVTSTQSFTMWNRGPSVNRLLRHGREDKIYSFGVRETCYKVEITAMWYPDQKVPCWGIAVRHVEWATHLAELERLQTGHQASWGDTIATFLPKDGGSSSVLEEEDDYGVSKLKLKGIEVPARGPSREGIRTLTNILLQVSEIVSSVTTSDRGAHF